MTAQTTPLYATDMSQRKTACGIAGDAMTLLRWTSFRGGTDLDMLVENTSMCMEAAG